MLFLNAIGFFSGLIVLFIDEELNFINKQYFCQAISHPYQEHLHNFSLFTHRYINYKGWIFTGYKSFIEQNNGSIKYLSIEGVPQPLLS